MANCHIYENEHAQLVKLKIYLDYFIFHNYSSKVHDIIYSKFLKPTLNDNAFT